MDQQLRLGRLVLEDAQASHQKVTIDLVFQGNAVKPGIEYFGIWRDENQESSCPFVMSENGEVDFGTGYSGDDRFYEFDIMTAPIAIGNEIGWRSDQYETTMKVVSVVQLV